PDSDLCGSRIGARLDAVHRSVGRGGRCARVLTERQSAQCKLQSIFTECRALSTLSHLHESIEDFFFSSCSYNDLSCCVTLSGKLILAPIKSQLYLSVALIASHVDAIQSATEGATDIESASSWDTQCMSRDEVSLIRSMKR